MPDQRAHQFYPTPDELAIQVAELANIGAEHTCLEPSAGIGGIADHMPKDRTRCVEISDLHCKVLEAKGFDVTQADFLSWAGSTADRFDRVAMKCTLESCTYRPSTFMLLILMIFLGRLLFLALGPGMKACQKAISLRSPCCEQDPGVKGKAAARWMLVNGYNHPLFAKE